MKQLVLTGLGNEMDLKTGKSIFTAIFNNSVRIEISKEAAEVLTSNIYSSEKEAPAVDDYSKPPAQAEDREEEEGYLQRASNGEDLITGAPILHDEPASVYDEDTGVEQV